MLVGSGRTERGQGEPRVEQIVELVVYGSGIPRPSISVGYETTRLQLRPAPYPGPDWVDLRLWQRAQTTANSKGSDEGSSHTSVMVESSMHRCECGCAHRRTLLPIRCRR